MTRPPDGPEWRVFRRRFLEVTARALHAAVLAPEPVRLLGRSGFPVLGSLDQQRLRRDEELRTELVLDAVIRALDTFTAKLLRGDGWRPGLASLDNYVIRGALLALADGAKRWRRARERDVVHLVDDDPRDLPEPAVAGPEDRVVDAESAGAAIDLLESIDELVARAVRLRVATDEGWDLIARRLGVPASTLEKRRKNAVARLRRMLEERGEDDGQL